MNCPSLIYVAPSRSNNFRSANGAENSSAAFGSDVPLPPPPPSLPFRLDRLRRRPPPLAFRCSTSAGKKMGLFRIAGGRKSCTVRVSATYAWMERAGPARGPASATAETRSRTRDWNSSGVRSFTDFLGGIFRRLVLSLVDVDVLLIVSTGCVRGGRGGGDERWV